MELEKIDYGAGKLQQRALGILVFLDKICKELGLTYYMAYGTLLGAVRHGGFIPWDDDIDVWMPRDDYDKLLNYLSNENTDEQFVLSAGEVRLHGARPSELQMRIYDLKSHIRYPFMQKQTDSYMWIDIFALDSFPKEKKNKYFKSFKNALTWYKIARCKNVLIPQKSVYGLMNRIIYTLHQKLHLFKFILDEDKKLAKVVKTITQYKELDSDEYFCYAAVYLGSPEKCFFKREWFADPVTVVFEGYSFLAPSNYDAVLKTVYNDYMTPPPEEKRVYTHSIELID